MFEVMQAIVSMSDPYQIEDVTAGAVGQQPPSWILKAVREADPEFIRGYLPQLNANKTTLETRVTEIQQELTNLSDDWTGEAADAAIAYLEKVIKEVDGLAQVQGATATILEAAINVMKVTQRSEDDATRTFVIALVTATVTLIAAVALCWIFPPAGAAATAAAVAIWVSFAIAIIGGIIAYLISLHIIHSRNMQDLTEQLDKLNALTPGEPLTDVSPVATPDLQPVTIKTTIAEPPAVPSFG